MAVTLFRVKQEGKVFRVEGVRCDACEESGVGKNIEDVLDVFDEDNEGRFLVLVAPPVLDESVKMPQDVRPQGGVEDLEGVGGE